MPERVADYDGTFFRGAKSDSDPGQLPLGYYHMGINVINTGGVLSCRPGMRCIVKFPEGKLQGATLFRPRFGLEQMVVCIDGVVYVAEWPFISFRFLSNVQMSPHAKQVFWALTTQSAERRTNDFASAINVIPPKNVLFIQDGGNTAPAWYDGSQSGHIRDFEFQTPAGGPMVWIGDRLWVAQNDKVFASDVSNPFSFREQIYLGGQTAFYFSSDVTAMSRTPSLAFPQLIIFTESNASIIQANIRDRDLWTTTQDFQKEVFQVGAASHRSVVSHFGQLMWFSNSGIVFFDAAIAGQVSARLPIRDNEMLKSKTRLADDLTLTAGAAFGQYFLMSVPSEDRFNRHTWVLNNASLETLTDDSGPSWPGYWLGTRPVEWVYGQIAGQERIFHVSTDEDDQNRLWECFRPERLDNLCPIMWAVETRGYFGQTAQVRKSEPGVPFRLHFADLAICGIEEELDIGVFYAGGLRGAYTPILAKRISVERGSLVFDQEITVTTELFAYKGQSRILRTEDANAQPIAGNESGSCPVETGRIDGLDESFQLLIVGHGPATIRWIKVFGTEEPEQASGDPAACQSEDPYNAVRFDGAGVRSADLATLDDQFLDHALRLYLSNQTVTLTQDSASATGVGSSESVVSQGAADRVASRIATREAEIELQQTLPPIFSVGQGFDE
jgi:hypothetical protein